MYRQFLTLVISLVVCMFPMKTAIAESGQDAFTKYMLDWRDKSQLAQLYLSEAKDSIKDGMNYQTCLKQRVASRYGVDALNSLVKAKNLEEEQPDLENIQINLARWRKLANCSLDNPLFN